MEYQKKIKCTKAPYNGVFIRLNSLICKQLGIDPLEGGEITITTNSKKNQVILEKVKENEPKVIL